MRNLQSSGSRFVSDTVGIEARRFCVRLGAQSPNRIRAKSVCVRLAVVVYYFRACKIQAVHGWRPSFRASTVQRSSRVRLPTVCLNLSSHFTADVRLLTKKSQFQGYLCQASHGCWLPYLNFVRTCHGSGKKRSHGSIDPHLFRMTPFRVSIKMTSPGIEPGFTP